MSANLTKAVACWGDDIPDWVQALAKACDLTSQAQVARKLGRSSALVNQLLQKKYPGDLKAIQERIEGMFMNAVLSCPALGNIPAHECQNWREQAKQFANTNALRVRMYHACKTCPKHQD